MYTRRKPFGRENKGGLSYRDAYARTHGTIQIILTLRAEALSLILSPISRDVRGWYYSLPAIF